MSKKYFNYLFKSKKALSLFVVVSQIVIYFAILLTSTSRNIEGTSMMYMLSWFIGTALCFILPFLFLHYVLNKKAVDVYMSIPVDRKKMIITTGIYMYLLVFIPQLIFFIANIFFYKTYILTVLYASFWMFLYLAGLLIFNSGILLIGNSVVDSLIIVGSYALLPVFLGFVVSSFNSSLIVGIETSSSSIMINTSLIAVYLNYLLNLFQAIRLNYPIANNVLALVSVLVVYTLIGLYSIKKNFIDRQMERAEGITDGFFGYRFLIHFIFGCVTLAITLSFARNYSLMYMVENCSVWYVALVILYIIATFIYKRKFNLRPFSIVFIIAVIVLSNIFTKVAFDTEGFKLSYKYDHNPKNMMINGNGYITLDGELIPYTIYEGDSRIGENYSIYYRLEIDSKNKNKENIYELVNEIRDKSIKNYFSTSRVEDKGLWFSLVTNYNEHIENYWYDDFDNSYYSNAPLTIEDLKKLYEYGTKIEIIKERYDDYLNIYETEEIEFSDFLKLMH